MIESGSRVGRLSEEPLPEVFGALALDRRTCLVRLTFSSGPAEIYLQGGLAVAVELPGNIDRLGELLVSGGAIDAETLRRALTAPRLPGQRLGRLLVDAGLVPEQKVQVALRLQIRRRLHRLFFSDDGDFAVEAGDHGRGEGPDRVSVDLRPAITLAVRSGWNENRYGPRLPSSRLRLTVDQAALQPYGFQPAEVALLAPLAKGPCSVTELVVSANEGSTALVRPTVYALLATGALVRDGITATFVAPPERGAPSSGSLPRPDNHSGPATPSRPIPTPATGQFSARTTGPITPATGQLNARTTGPIPTPVDRTSSGSPSASPPGGRAVTVSSRSGPGTNSSLGSDAAVAVAGKAISEKRASIDTQDLFQVLGVSREAGRAEIKAAYLEAARLYHPDRLSAAGLLHLREAAEHIFRRVSEAHATLTDDTRRAAYVDKLSVPPEVRDAQAKAQRVVAAEMALMEGDVALKRRDFPTAIERLAEAVELNPDEGEAIALLAWARFSCGLAGLVEQRADFERAVSKAPQCARAHYYLGMVRKQARETHGAISSFRRAAELDPRLAEAASELRVLSLRATRELPTMARPKSLLDRLLKK